MGGLARSWALARASWQVLLGDKELMLFPVLSALCTLIAVAVFVLPVMAIMQATRGAGGRETDVSDPVSLALLFLFYLVTSFVTLFFNTALVGAALDRLRGGDPHVGTGFGIALQHLPSIFVYALISATVGMVLHTLERRAGFVGQIVASILGGAWAVVTFLVVPVMVVEGQNPFATIRRSADLLHQTWGAQFAGNLGLGGLLFLLALPGVPLLVLGFMSANVALLAICIAIAVIYWGILAVVATALGQIFRAAVYVYATNGNVPAQFDSWMVQDAFRTRGHGRAA